jgi:hypothetical protein
MLLKQSMAYLKRLVESNQQVCNLYVSIDPEKLNYSIIDRLCHFQSIALKVPLNYH